jgi:hypothetical protein
MAANRIVASGARAVTRLGETRLHGLYFLGSAQLARV